MTYRWSVTSDAGTSGGAASGSVAEAVEASLARAVTQAVREETLAIKADLRRDTAAALKGNRLPMAWRSKVFPQGHDSVDAAGWVEVRASAADIIGMAMRGGVIRAKGGKWLAIPTREAGRFGLKRGAGGFGVTTNSRGARERITPGGFERRTGMKLRFVYDSGRRAFLVVDGAQLNRGIAGAYRGRGRGSKLYGPAGRTFVVFILVPQVTVPKRMDPDEIVAASRARFGGRVSRHWKE